MLPASSLRSDETRVQRKNPWHHRLRILLKSCYHREHATEAEVCCASREKQMHPVTSVPVRAHGGAAETSRDQLLAALGEGCRQSRTLEAAAQMRVQRWKMLRIAHHEGALWIA